MANELWFKTRCCGMCYVLYGIIKCDWYTDAITNHPCCSSIQLYVSHYYNKYLSYFYIFYHFPKSFDNIFTSLILYKTPGFMPLRDTLSARHLYAAPWHTFCTSSQTSPDARELITAEFRVRKDSSKILPEMWCFRTLHGLHTVLTNVICYRTRISGIS
jgi:hypothetical protein